MFCASERHASVWPAGLRSVKRRLIGLVGNVGGGVKWFATPHVGLWGDARLIMVKNKDEAPFFNQADSHYGTRVYAGVLPTY